MYFFLITESSIFGISVSGVSTGSSLSVTHNSCVSGAAGCSGVSALVVA